MEESLKGHLILADPCLKEPTFFQSVLLLTEHSENGALGYILNRPIGRKVGELISDEVIPSDQRDPLVEVPVYMGGPVSTEHLTFSALAWSESEDTLQYSTHLSAAEAVVYQMEGFDIRAFVGYSGWEQGQLEQELEGRSWIVQEPSRDITQQHRYDYLWKDLIRDLSPWHRLVADEPDELGLN
ncbi:MAG: YqgE/AlgH family protein [Verrucomicrobiota bacterium]